jgi:hypothetical protein
MFSIDGVRFLKLLLIAWAALSLAQMRTPSVESLGGALIIAGVTWLVIRGDAPDAFHIISRPSAAILLVVGVLGIGNYYNATEHTGLKPDERLVDATLTVAGLLALVGLIGVLFLPWRRADARTGAD